MSLVSFLFSIGRVAATKVTGKFNAVLFSVVGLATDGSATDAESSSDNPGFSALGAYGRPETPASDLYCDSVNIRFGDGLIPFGFRDDRISKRVNPSVGELGLAHYGGGYLDFSWSRDRLGTVVSLSAPHLDGSDNVDSAHYLSMDPADANNAVILAHRIGQAVSLTKEGKVVITSPDGTQTIVVANDGVTLGGKMNFFGGIVAGNSTTAEAVLLSPQTIALLSALLNDLAIAFATPAVNGSPLAPTWATTVVPALQALLTQLQTEGTATTLKASAV